MTQQYIRKVSLIVGKDNGDALDLSQMRFTFSVRRGDLQNPNTADIRVYNLSDATVKAIQSRQPRPEFTRVVLQAGYEGNFGIIFDGSITQIRVGRENQTDTYLDLIGADGDEAYNFSLSSYSLPAGSTPNESVTKLIRDLSKSGIEKGYLPDLPGNPLPRGKVVFGMTREELRNLARNTNTTWSIQDGKVNFIPLTSYKPGDILVITSATGLIGLPTQTQSGIELECLLNPFLKVGQLVKLDNKSIQQYRYNPAIPYAAANDRLALSIKTNADGYYYVMQANHYGDTRGDAYYTELICLAVDATAINAQTNASPPAANAVRKYG